MKNKIYQLSPFNDKIFSYSFQKPILFGVTINEKDFMKEKDFSFSIEQDNNIQIIQLGRTGMYQINKPIIGSIIFPVDTPQSVKLDIIQIQE